MLSGFKLRSASYLPVHLNHHHMVRHWRRFGKLLTKKMI
jgi:hypothetical protein